jgi:hypothetical protein
MSIQTECREAMTRLARQGGIFTEIDVANEARKSEWSGTLLERALKDSHRICASEYKKGVLVRFGPVEFKGHQDYARKATKIVYAHAQNGPQAWDTPNGKFPRLLARNDSLARAGRKVGTDRDDTKPWSMQAPLRKVEELKGPPIDPKPFLKRIQELEAELKQARNENHNGNGNGHREVVEAPPAPVVQQTSLAVAVNELADLLEDRLAGRLEEKLDERIRERFAEKLIA